MLEYPVTFKHVPAVESKVAKALDLQVDDPCEDGVLLKPLAVSKVV